MPGLRAFGRHWRIGSDDIVLPAILVFVMHLACIAIMTAALVQVLSVDESSIGRCGGLGLRDCLIGFITTLSVGAAIEVIGAVVSTRGSILVDRPRSAIEYLLYARLAIQVALVGWLLAGTVWLARYYESCLIAFPNRVLLGVVVFQWTMTLATALMIWCTYDEFGRRREVLCGKETPGDDERRVRAVKAYARSWDRCFRRTFCCIDIGGSENRRQSFDEIARLFARFFVQRDVVPTDVVAGLVLMRRRQRLVRRSIAVRAVNGTKDILSGIPITPSTEFLDNFDDQPSTIDFDELAHYMRYAHAAYGWPMILMANPRSGLCKLLPHLTCRCFCCCDHSKEDDSGSSSVHGDNCCGCNVAALRQLARMDELDVVFVTYQTDISSPSFYIAVDYRRRSVVVAIRGTLSLHDVLTDLDADAMQVERLLDERWMGHKGIVDAAIDTLQRIKTARLIETALERDPDRGTREFEVVVVGHSLGGGTAAVLAILLRHDDEYRRLPVRCFAYSPPGGLFSEQCVVDTRSFITTVVLGKDVVPRIGVHQLDEFRHVLIELVEKSSDPKWKIIASGSDIQTSSGPSTCCCCRGESYCDIDADVENFPDLFGMPLFTDDPQKAVRNSMTSTSNQCPLYVPGKVVHIVYKGPPPTKCCFGTRRDEIVYRAIRADNKTGFNEVLISNKMINDHRPEKVLAALEQILARKRAAHSSKI